ncbi:MAG: tripartite tricarboxylate transporter TctB family protein [Candidatus Methylomirabilota bacterium]
MLEAVVIGLIGMLAIGEAVRLPHAQEFSGVLAYLIGPGSMPFMLGAVLIGLSLALVERERRLRRASGESGGPSLLARLSAARSSVGMYLAIAGVLLFYVLLLGTLPFPVLTLLFFLLFYGVNYAEQLRTPRVLLRVAVLSVVATVFIAYVMPLSLSMPLP